MAIADFKKTSDEIHQIVLVDDDEDDRYLFTEAFEELKIQAELLLFKNGLEFIEYLGSGIKNLPKLIFLDLNMPIMNGMDCLKHIRLSELGKDIFVAIYSTSSAENDMKSTLQMGANIYIKKPNNFNELTEVINRTVQMQLQYMTGSLNKDHFPLTL